MFSQAAELITNAKALVFAAGAGIGVDSGLPDFRGNYGFWNAYPALAKANLDFTQVASPQTFEDDPALAWGFYGHRLALYRETVPHDGFQILKKWAARTKYGARVFTSNVDGQFQKAGFTQEQMHECHGSIHHLQCMQECSSGVWRADDFHPELNIEACRLLNAPPTCPVCGRLARPNILMFNDWHWQSGRRDLQRQMESAWFTRVARAKGNIVIVEMGAGTALPSVRNFSAVMSRNYGARIVRINPREWHVTSRKDVGIAAASLKTLLGIDAEIDRQYSLKQPEPALPAKVSGASVKRVIFLDQARAESQTPLVDAAMISITEHDQEEARIQDGWKQLLRLKFDDIDLPEFRSQSQQELLDQYQARFGTPVDQLAFTPAQAKELVAWLECIEDSVQTIVVHCRKGESRSGAVAKYLCSRYGLAFDDSYQKYNKHVYGTLQG